MHAAATHLIYDAITYELNCLILDCKALCKQIFKNTTHTGIEHISTLIGKDEGSNYSALTCKGRV